MLLTIQEHEKRLIARAKDRAEQINRKIEAEERTRSLIADLRYRVASMTADYKTFTEARRQPIFNHAIKEMEYSLGTYIAKPLREKALSVAKDLVESAEIQMFSRATYGDRDIAANIELVVAFMHPKTYHIRRSIKDCTKA